MIGNTSEMIAFVTQWAELPRAWPLDRTRLGKTSPI